MISFAGDLSLGIPLEIVFIGIPLEIVFKGDFSIYFIIYVEILFLLFNEIKFIF